MHDLAKWALFMNLKRALALAGGLTALTLSGCGYSNPYGNGGKVATTITNPSPSPSPSVQTGGDSFKAGANQRSTELSDGLRYIDLKTGTGAVAQPGDSVSVQYTGWLSSGKVFDSSWSRGQPFTFTIGKTAVIKGWSEGIPGMRVGGKRKLIIPPSLGYGSSGQPPTIPANATLTFEVTVVKVTAGH